METATSVGSDALERKYDLGVSPATIRNEMGELTRIGYLRQVHTSAGRLPTPKAIKFYVHQLMEEKTLSVGEEAAAKQKVSGSKENVDKLLKETTKALATQTGSLAIAVTQNGEVWHSGYAYILSNPEFYNIDVTQTVLSLLEQSKKVKELLLESSWPEPVKIVFGEETGWKNFESVGIVVAHFETPNVNGCLGVIGPTRLRYPVIIPTVRYFGTLLSEAFA